MQEVITKLALLAVICLTLSSCATPYQPSGFRGGYSDFQVDANTFRVEFEGNGYTSDKYTSLYLLYRCAELTTQQGYDYFVIIGQEANSQTGFLTTPGSFQANTSGSRTTGTMSPGFMIPISFPSASAVIKVYKGDKPSDHPAAFNAKELLEYLGPKVKP